MSEHRCLENVCVHAAWTPQQSVADTSGFLLTDTLIPFGGIPLAEETCGPCPANVAMPSAANPRWAGCHGLLILDPADAVEARAASIIGSLEQEASSPPPLPAALLALPRLWLESPLPPANLLWNALVWDSLSAEQVELPGLAAFRRAIEAALAHELPLHVQAYPAGIRSARHWRVPAHCPRCSSPREEGSTTCPICHTSEAAEIARKRFAKGERPYWQLARFMGEQAADEFLQRYAVHRASEA